MNRFTFKLMTAVAGLGLMTVNALAQERERDERREGERRERTERDSDRERPEASAAAAGNAANAAAAANGRAEHKPVAAAEEAVFRDVPPAGRVVPAVSEALRVIPVDSCGCFRSWLRDADGNGEISAEEIKAAPAAQEAGQKQ